jgi:hypothetical protein
VLDMSQDSLLLLLGKLIRLDHNLDTRYFFSLLKIAGSLCVDTNCFLGRYYVGT